MSRFHFIALAFVLSLPQTAGAIGTAEGLLLTGDQKANRSAAVAKQQKFDRATIGQVIEINNPDFIADLGEWACSFLTRENVANWNVAGGECKFIKFLSTPTHGKFVPTSKAGEFSFQPIRLGKDSVRFLVENTVDGRRAIVLLHITVVKPEA